MLNNGLLQSTTSQKTNANYLDRQSRFESNVRSYPRKLPLAIAKAHGVWVTDVEGTTYLDCLAGAGTLALGHNHEAIMASLDSFLTSGMPMHTLDLTTAVKDAFSETLLSLLPGQGRDYCLQFCGPSGADAVEAAIKLAKTATGRHNIISFSGAYHGMTHGALALTGNTAPKNAVTNLMPGVQFLPYPHEYRCPLGIGGEAGTEALSYYFTQFIEDVESGPAAVILEAVQGEGGVNPAPAAWLRQIREVTRKHGILLILDEVQAGFGRTGKMFAFEHAGIEPDVIVMSKAVGGGLPLAVLGFKREFDAWAPGNHAGTFRGNQMAMATGLATLEVLQRQNLAAQAAKRGDWLKAQLGLLQQRYPMMGQVRGRGLMLGIEIVDERKPADRLGSLPMDPELAVAIQQHCFKQGLLLERGGRNGNVIRLLPPLIITEEQCQLVIQRFEDALKAALAQLRK
ncbi:diaminobutyrate--2-oxoglutarate aminotransferase [Pseudomonas savastanoi pv. fraxini]|uniref:diaminobutyrate--2-oxoglutarate transaminase n=1 Tax=Pseudomonas savastanoi TaxID=29438 RepID=UPI00073A2244|nr:diaminobutyrate--2-oxoglutarate transaminase [Pseudomonas savastanoi]KUG40413.1 Diaminobutyrate--2-oxoglutarate transaminase [Pseudomonas savastanoi pv. fraxini]KWS73750.1 diaminobutyrate--2-oxoglutarate aminotransferase [Pseudomonas savastanoi pv. fraxini]PAB31336.1 diaminobutyrate--2-oxoglutarate transaminase [Pseudomonas savastanoi pv. fraxini]RMR65828.1 Diaminobutyrate--2-oxoglutarate transaminase [Pseudomonas savastanoi pv. fraxini]RMR69809.1 Diaminobutyrate--2-oxoglutarate transaminas